MTCAMRLHDPCAGEVRIKTLAGHEVPLCMRHGMLLARRRVQGERRPPFRWQTDEQLERWAVERAARQAERDSLEAVIGFSKCQQT